MQSILIINICFMKNVEASPSSLMYAQTQSAFTCSKLTAKTLEQGVKYVQS